MLVGVVVFPGSNCDRDALWAIEKGLGESAKFIWHHDRNLSNVDLVILPGGFSYGDYLRTGVFARFSPVMESVKDFAKKGGLVIGICNGFQVLLEAGLLPGALIANKNLRFLCKDVFIRVEKDDGPFSKSMSVGEVLQIPIAHFGGNYFAEPEELAKLESNGQVVFRYCNKDGDITAESNPNGSLHNIAGITNERGNIMGMMPHPERCSEAILGSDDGLGIFASVKKYLGLMEENIVRRA
ncbi:phosphoribosylformylglycinamidine synthase subunit PurQ [bacterium]|nr:phosphoribosylformylglycinamidine synthase subunit PurQ [bacterium]